MSGLLTTYTTYLGREGRLGEPHRRRADAERRARKCRSAEQLERRVDARRERAERPEAPRRGRGDVPDEAHLALGVHLVEGEALGLGLELGLGLGLGLGLSTW